MDSLGAFPDGNWDFINRLLFADDDFSMQSLFPDHGNNNDCWFSNENIANMALVDESLLFQSSHNQSFLLPSLTQETYNLYDSSPISIANDVDSCVPMFSNEPERSTFESESLIVPKLDKNPKKRPRVSSPNVQRTRKKVQSKKEETSEISNSSEDDSNASQELDGIEKSDKKVGAAPNLNGKTRGNKASATDSQSLYARKRREKINERLKVLQNLVPNGTKVDISTMLEEAVHYVKFLQLQIKLLSSDDLWMYSPIAYNGMDIGLLRTISPTL